MIVFYVGCCYAVCGDLAKTDVIIANLGFEVLIRFGNHSIYCVWIFIKEQEVEVHQSQEWVLQAKKDFRRSWNFVFVFGFARPQSRNRWLKNSQLPFITMKFHEKSQLIDLE